MEALVAYRYGERNQVNMFPPSIEEYVSEDDPVRAYDAFVEALDFNELGIATQEVKAGCPQYDPRAMLKTLLYGYSYGIRSSRRLERAVYHNISFIWLAGGLKPDHKTISNFRRHNKKALKGIMKQCARMCVKLGLIEGNTLFVDGTKVRGNASIDKTLTKEKAGKLLNKLNKRIDAILSECDVVDESESESVSFVKMNKELSKKETLKAKIVEALNELEKGDKKNFNTTDPDCVRFKSRQGSHSGYNAQVVVDDANGLIVSGDVVGENHDYKQFAQQIDRANAVLEKDCETACADAGYASIEELEKVDDKGILVVVPTTKQASKKEPGEFDRNNFKYDKELDLYLCPEGKELKFWCIHKKDKNARVYRIRQAVTCLNCTHFGACTPSKMGRTIRRYPNIEVKAKLEKLYESDAGQAVYKRRKERAELPFGHIKRNLGVQSFLLRGLDGVRAEMSLLATCFNIRRMITILGVATMRA